MKARKGNELPRLMKILISANARYFCRVGYETEETLLRVERWLNGVDDKEIEAKVICWIKSDKKWSKEIWKGVARRFWYLWPVVWFISHRIEGLLEDVLRKLNETRAT